MSDPDKCRCLSIEESGITATHYYDYDSECLVVETKELNQTHCYRHSYGFDVCEAHDEKLQPHCGESQPFPPDWCSELWCFVDPRDCANFEPKPSVYFPESGLHYSYELCGGRNTFDVWVNGNVQGHTLSNLVGFIEDNVISTKHSVEEWYDHFVRVANLSSPKTIELECQEFLEGCEFCEKCEWKECWRRSVDFDSTTTLISPQLRQKAEKSEPEALNILACQTELLSRDLRRIAGSVYKRERGRVAYAYHADQKSGALVQWPKLESCVITDDYDPRLRPWYASAVSGSKDVVLVIDVSGTMEGNRIKLAAKAAKAVLRTLTWADYFTIITFSNLITTYKETLVPATEEEVLEAMDWIEEEVADPVGGTNFIRPLGKAYDILQPNNLKNDSPHCSQAILFLTDGDDETFLESKLEETKAILESNKDVVVFTYGLSVDANREPLEWLACSTGGIFYSVLNTEDLPGAMASYFNYFVQLQDTCKVRWIQYTDAFTKVPLLSACAAVFDYPQEETEEPSIVEVVGVTCLDLNLLVSLDHLKSCETEGYEKFTDVVRRETQECSSKTVSPCVLRLLRENAGFGGRCPQDASLAQNCSSVLQQHASNSSNCSNLDVTRFDVITLEGCSRTLVDCEAFSSPTPVPTHKPTNSAPPTDGKQNLGSGNDDRRIISISVAVPIAAVLMVALWWKVRSGMRKTQTRRNTPLRTESETDDAPIDAPIER